LNGICVKKKCVCKKPFEGDDCSVNKTQKFISSLNMLDRKSHLHRKIDEFSSFAQINETIVSTKKEDGLKNYSKIDIEDNSWKSIVSMALILFCVGLLIIFSFLICNNRYLYNKN